MRPAVLDPTAFPVTLHPCFSNTRARDQEARKAPPLLTRAAAQDPDAHHVTHRGPYRPATGLAPDLLSSCFSRRSLLLLTRQDHPSVGALVPRPPLVIAEHG